MQDHRFTRRTALALGAGAPAALALAGGARAAAPLQGVDVGRVNRLKLGDFEITTLLAATRTVPDPHSIFGLNVDDATFAAVSAEHFLPADRARFFFTPVLVNTGSELVLFDTGLAPDQIAGALAAAGLAPGDVDRVVITHAHPDHVGGLFGEAGATFPDAAHVIGRVEFDAWAAMGADHFEARVRPLAERFERIEDGAGVAPGISAMAAFGHTPGHLAFVVESAGQSLLIGADFANHPVWSLARPDWEVKFDMDKAQAAATRRRLLEMLASERMPFAGYHMPWPGVGYVERRGDSFGYVPHSYQLMMG